MTKLDTTIESKQNEVVGTLNQAKGVAREKMGKVTNNTKMVLGGKKDQVVGTLQKSVGNSWAYRNKNALLLAVTAVSVIAATVFYLVNRDS